MDLISKILCSVFWLMIEKFKLAKLIIVVNWRRKGIFVTSRSVSFKYHFYSRNLEIVSILMSSVVRPNLLFYIELTQLYWSVCNDRHLVEYETTKIRFLFISHHFLPMSLFSTYRVAIFSLQGAFCFNIDTDLKLMGFKIFIIQWASSSYR